jgi:hypothetical protein
MRFNFLEHFKHTGQCINMVRLSANCVRAFQKDQQTLHACSPVTAALQWQYLQMELILWICFILPAALWPWGQLQEYSWGKGWLVGKADNLTAICEPIV